MGTVISSDTLGSNNIVEANDIAGSNGSTFNSSGENVGDNNIDDSESAYLPCISCVKISDHVYWCKICNICSSDKEQLENHVKGEEHRIAQKKYGCKYISLKEKKQYYCGCCNYKLESRKYVLEHITDARHICKANMLCISIKPINDKKYSCRICNVESSSLIDLEIHVKGIRHRKAQKEYGCNNIVLKDSNQYYCRCCDSTLSNHELAFEHIKEKKHMPTVQESDEKEQLLIKEIPKITQSTEQPKIALNSDCIKEEKPMMNDNLPCISIKSIKDQKYYCRICNVESSSEIDLGIHVKGIRHRAAQKYYGCNNIVLKDSNQYYCRCCNATLSNGELAFEHIKDKNHLMALRKSNEKEKLISEGVPKITQTTEQPKIALNSDCIKEEKPMINDNLPCISIKLIKDKKYYCRICYVESSSEIDLGIHVKGIRHRRAQKEYGCNNIVLNDSNQYYCRCCNATLSNGELAFEHIKDKNHLTALRKSNEKEKLISEGVPKITQTTEQPKIALNSDCIKKEKPMINDNLPCISIKPIKDKKYYCRICNVESSSEIDLGIHVKGIQHRTAQKYYGYNNIVLKDSNQYYCRCCNATLSNGELAFQHIKDKNHLMALKASDEKEQLISEEIPKITQSTEQPKIALNSDCIKEEKYTRNNNLPCISIKPTKDKKYHCRICNVESSSVIDLGIHVKGIRHRAAQKYYGYNNIVLKDSNQYYCRCCNATLSNGELAFQHIKDKNHLMALKASDEKEQLISKEIPKITQSTEQPKIALNSDCIKEEKPMINDNLPCISIKPIKDQKYYCRICNVESSSETDLGIHVKGIRHRAAQKYYGYNNIVLKDINQYYCICCNSTLSNRELAFEHIKDKNHLMALRKSDEKEKLISEGVPKKTQTTEQPKIALNSDCIKEEKPMINDNLPCISIKPIKDKKYYCRICNVESSSEIDLGIHVKGIQHRTAQKYYGYNNIVLKDSNRYYCRCCNATLSNGELAFQHIKDKNHLMALKASDEKEQLIIKEIPKMAESTEQSKSIYEATCKNSSYRYILEENSTDSYCAVCDCLICSQTNVQAHATGKQHLTALNKFSDNKIILEKRYFYYCEYCGCGISGFKNVDEHIGGFTHTRIQNSMSIKKSVAENQEIKTSKTITVKLETKKVDNVSGFTPKDLLYNFITKVDEDLHCTVCRITITNHAKVKDHIKENQHRIDLQKFHVNRISLKNNSFYCQFCDCQIPSYLHVDQHIMGRIHVSLRNSSNLKQKLSNTITVQLETKQSDVSVLNPKDLLSNTIGTSGKGLICRVCNINITNMKDHVTENQHKIGLLKFHENQISFENNHYYCNFCACEISTNWYDVHYHVKGKKHISLLTLFPQKKEPANQSIANEANVMDKPNLKAISSSVSTKPEKSEKQFSQVTSKEKKVKTLRFKKTMQKFSFEKGQMRCSVCNDSVAGAVNLHKHLAQHFSNDFITSDKDDKSMEQKKVTKTENSSQFKQIEDVNRSEKVFKKIEREVNMKKIINDLDFDANNIYSMEEKAADIELGMQLCFPFGEDNTYCLVCQKTVENSMEDYYQHLRTLDHCEYLDKMEADHSLFCSFPDQFSQLDLALQYMMETTDNYVYCLVCDLKIENMDFEIQQHIYEQSHNEKCVKFHEKAKKNFENIKLMHCDWYEVQTYWCVPCITRFRSEVNFAKHLKSQIHVECIQQKQNKKRKMIFDFCAPCALLWYGYRCTSAYHDDVPTHMWLTRDGHYSSTVIPESVKLLLANPEDYVSKTIKYFDDISAKEREKEATLIRDIEKSVKTKFFNAKAYTFGSRVSGLGSADSDIDVFLDCGNMYDGESSSMDQILKCMTDVHECLSKEPHLWDIEELLTMCRSPIIKVHHRDTGLSCDISFENGLAVENTRLIKLFNDIFPSCRKIILIVKEWLKLCKLSGSERITSYALYWYVIFYLQNESILPSIAKLIGMGNRSHIIAGWEVGVFRDFTSNEMARSFSIKELLIGFFKFYANFDYRYKVACPLLGEVVTKRTFTDPESLPEAMRPYKAHVKKSSEIFRIDSVMCIQDPFDLQHNLSKAVSKVYVNRFKKYCSTSLDVLSAF